MKRNVLIVLIILAVVALPGAMAAERPHLDVSLLSYTPVPAEPGQYVTVSIKVLNDGDATAQNAVIEFENNYPFSVENAGSKRKNIGPLGAQEDYLAEYRVRIDSAALPGRNYLKVRYIADASTTTNWIEKEIPLTVTGVQKTVGINSVVVNPEMIAPGEQADVRFRVKNLASSDMRDVTLTLNLAGTLVGTEYIDLPFAPIGSSVEKRTSLLRSGETTDFTYVLQSYPTATAGIYKIPLTLSYTDDEGTDYSRTDLMSIVVSGEPDVLVQIDSSDVYSDNGKGTVVFSVTNRGFDEIKFLTISLAKSDDYEILSSSNETYLGNVDSDDYDTAEFEIKMAKEGLTQSTLPVTLTFKDALNNEYSIEKQLKLSLITTAEAGQKDSKAGLYIIIVVVLAVIIFFVYRSRKKKKRK